MEQVLEREAAAKIDWRNIVMYDDEGKRITNPKTLRAMAEAVEIGDAWERRVEATGMAEALRRYYEGDDELDPEEED